MRRLPLLLALLAAVALAPATAGAQTTTAPDVVAEAADALRTDSVYVAPGNAAGLTEADADQVRTAVRGSDVPIHVAVFAPGAGEPRQLAASLYRELRATGVYAVVAGPTGRTFQAGQTGDVGLDAGVAREAAAEAVQAEQDAGGTAILLDFVGRVDDAHANGGALDGGGADGLALLIGAVAIGGGVGAFALMRNRRTRRERAEQAAELRRVADEDLVALGDDIRALDLDVEMPGADERAKADYARALTAHEQASAALATARAPDDFAPIAQTLEEGRYAMEAAKARLAGEEPPEHRPPCFFDPRHGPSSRDVEWSPEYGAPRPVPACEADAQRVERGEDPHAREIELAGGRGRVPYWQAPAYYGPYAGGFYGGFGGSGLVTGLFAGSLLGSAWAAPTAWGAGDGGGGMGDFGGGGDFGFGGDFGGGGDF
ncbi:MAG TPA: hypothetical protein VNZ62_15865 [Capillimicrobium sp.]|nr:hypothetical protein [Capillimicrobium sp.]